MCAKHSFLFSASAGIEQAGMYRPAHSEYACPLV